MVAGLNLQMKIIPTWRKEQTEGKGCFTSPLVARTQKGQVPSSCVGVPPPSSSVDLWNLSCLMALGASKPAGPCLGVSEPSSNVQRLMMASGGGWSKALAVTVQSGREEAVGAEKSGVSKMPGQENTLWEHFGMGACSEHGIVTEEPEASRISNAGRSWSREGVR